MLWKVLSEFPGVDQSALPLCCGDIANFVIIRISFAYHLTRGYINFNYCAFMKSNRKV